MRKTDHNITFRYPEWINRVMSPAQIKRGRRIIEGEARALGVPRGLLTGGAGPMTLPEPVAAWARERAPNWIVAIDSAGGCSKPLADAICAAYGRSRC